MSHPTNSNTTQGRYWCFTINNYDDTVEPRLRELATDENTQYLVFGRELGAHCGTPHLQGYIELKKKWRGSTLKAALGGTAHIEARKAKAYQAAEYCKKDGDYEQFGEEPAMLSKDAKVRWRNVLSKCQEGDWAYMAQEEPYLWLMQEKKLRSHYKCPNQVDELDNEWIYGPTGTGKSRDARSRYPDAYIKDASSHWWDGYNGEEVVIIEDLDKYHVKQGYYLKIWADHYSFPAQIKGGQMMIRPRKIIVTSNYHPRDIWQDDTTVGPLERRFTLVHKPGQNMAPIFNFPPPQRIPVMELPEPIPFTEHEAPMDHPDFVRACDYLAMLEDGAYAL